MKFMFVLMFSVSVICGVFFGNLKAVSTAAVSSCNDAVLLFIEIVGVMCFWSGLMNLAVKSGLTDKLARLFSPVIHLLFKDVKANSKAAGAISLNLSASLMGLGNAVTPLGISAMKELDKLNNGSNRVSKSMVMLAVINTASVQLVPTTIIALRLSAGSDSPASILPAVWLSSLCSVCAGIMAVKALYRDRGK